MNDPQREKIIRLATYSYTFVYTVLVISAFAVEKTTGIVIALIFGLSSFAYALIYYLVFRQLEDDTKRLLAFTRMGNHWLEGISYRVAIATSLLVCVIFMTALFE